MKRAQKKNFINLKVLAKMRSEKLTLLTKTVVKCMKL